MGSKIFSVMILMLAAVCSQASVLKELDCDWDENSVTIPNRLTVKIDNAA